MAARPHTVRAAGGVLWRRTPQGQVEVAVVHRPRYDDWSLPKGKLARGEPALTGALREVQEETGYAAAAGRTLGTSRYDVLQDGKLLPKTVRWWGMRAGKGAFLPGDEVDELRWLAPADAERLLTAGRDAAPLRLLLATGPDTTTVLLVRHARAGERRSWAGDDLLRPLDPRGERQAELLCSLLRGYAPDRVLSASALRCRQTVAPLAESFGLPVELAAAVGEQEGGEDPEQAVALLRALAAGTGPAVVSSQGGVVPMLVQALAEGSSVDVGSAHSRKGSAWALTFAEGRLVDADHLPPLA